MTAPDLLDALAARYPAMLHVEAFEDGSYAIEISDPETNTGWVVSTASRHMAAGAAAAWERFRDALIHGPRPCTCGSLYTAHAWGSDAKRKGGCPEGGGRYEQAELDVLAGRQVRRG